mmetsp:Transcript_58724/g.108338  ORF Transcript_58724/g.108338 Transcript_58724/m.108338 type:complete len:169 (-) Transcript_58724:52-558(-)
MMLRSICFLWLPAVASALRGATLLEESRYAANSSSPFECVEEGAEIGKVDVHCKCPGGGKLVERPSHGCKPNGCGPDDPGLLATLGNALYWEVIGCCDVHDEEYCSCGYTKMFADVKFLTCMRDICGKKEWAIDRGQCQLKTEAAASAVLGWGTTAYKAAQDKACYCP